MFTCATSQVNTSNANKRMTENTVRAIYTQLTAQISMEIYLSE